MKRLFLLLFVCSIFLSSCNSTKAYTVKGDANKETLPKEEEYITFVANLNSKKYHLPDCYLIVRTKDENKWETTDLELLQDRGFSPCKICMD